MSVGSNMSAGNGFMNNSSFNMNMNKAKAPGAKPWKDFTKMDKKPPAKSSALRSSDVPGSPTVKIDSKQAAKDADNDFWNDFD